MQEFTTCFNKGYWQSALGELKKTKSLAICALFVALRIAVKSLRIYIIPGVLQVGFDFVVNSIGSMLFGPILALIGGLISDTVGAVLFPSGPYFFPYALIEMSSGFIFALFLYRCKLTGTRVILSRFTVVTICNLIMTPIVNYWYGVASGNETALKLLSEARIIKNVCLLPFECLILILFFSAISLPLTRLGLLPASNSNCDLRLWESKKDKKQSQPQNQQVSIKLRNHITLSITTTTSMSIVVKNVDKTNTITININKNKPKVNKNLLLLISLTLLSVGALILYFLYKTK